MHEEKRDVSMANCEPICNYVRQAKLVTVKQIALANETEAGLGDRWRWQPFLHHQYVSDASNSGWCDRHFPAHVYKRLNRLCHSKGRRCSSARRQPESPSA
jgi:hypothetical protein